MNIAEHKLSLFRQIDELPEELLLELENIIAKLRTNKATEPKQNLLNATKVQNFPNPEAKKLNGLWQEGIESGSSGLLEMQAIKAEALRRYNNRKESNNAL